MQSASAATSGFECAPLVVLAVIQLISVLAIAMGGARGRSYYDPYQPPPAPES
ncbi:hypothetical protein [Streptomyces sp. NPDC001809]